MTKGQLPRTKDYAALHHKPCQESAPLRFALYHHHSSKEKRSRRENSQSTCSGPDAVTHHHCHSSALILAVKTSQVEEGT